MMRRLWLSAALALVSLGTLGAQSCAPPVCSDLTTQTTLYLADADTAALYSVHPQLDPDRHRLLFITAVPEGVTGPHIAVTPDGRRIYLVDSAPKRLYSYDVLIPGWTDLGVISGLGQGTGITQAVIDSAGTTLYVGQKDVGIFSVDLTAPSPAATVEAFILDTSGGDLAFGINGEFYQANRGANAGTLDRIILTGDPFSRTIIPVGNGDLGGLEASGLASYPFIDAATSEYSFRLFASFGASPGASSGGMALLDEVGVPGESPVINITPFYLNGSIFVHDEGDIAVATCF